MRPLYDLKWQDFGAIRDSLLFCRPGMLDVYDVLVVFSVQEAPCWLLSGLPNCLNVPRP